MFKIKQQKSVSRTEKAKTKETTDLLFRLSQNGKSVVFNLNCIKSVIYAVKAVFLLEFVDFFNNL